MRCRSLSGWLLAAAGVLLSGSGFMMAGPPLEPVATPPLPEWMIKLHEIATGDPMKPGESPLIKSKTRFGWDYLAQKQGISRNGTISLKQYLEKNQGSPESFARLDRDSDGTLQASDFDWSDKSPFVQQQAQTAALFNRLNGDGDGYINPEEWKKGFDRNGTDPGKLTQDDLRRLMFGSAPRSTLPPTRQMRLFGFLTGELGSMNEGPNPGVMAPDFTLKTQDNQKTVQLSNYRNHKPVVLIFGNFT